MANETLYINLVRRELEQRSSKNPRYSLRAFAKALGFEATVISQILSGKRIPSFKTAQRLIQNLNLDPTSAQDFLASLAETQKNRGLQHMNPFFKQIFSTAALTQSSMHDLSIDYFRTIADWYHVAIMELTFVEGFQSNFSWIAKELGITVLEVKLAIERLIKLGLLQNKNGKLTKTQERLTTADKHLTTPALRSHQKQILEKAVSSVENDPIEIRNMSGMMMAADPKLIPEAKKMIEEFNSKVSRFLQSGRKTQVYQLHVSLFPIQKSKKENTSEVL
jgi:uncharacterized protein (TIGR02147 family)